MAKNNIIEHGDFSVDMGRFEEVILEMLPIFRKHRKFYEDSLIFPEFRFKKYFHVPEKKEFLAEVLFLSAYFDHNKRSFAHYRDMERLVKLAESKKLIPYLNELNAQQKLKFTNESDLTIFNESEKLETKKSGLISTIYNLDSRSQTQFVKKIARSIALDHEKYTLKIVSADKTNNSLAYVQDMLDMMVREYDENPLNIAKNKAPKEFYKDLQRLPGVGPGLAYLTVLFYSESGLIPYTTSELEGVKPKIDGNDMIVAKLTNILHVNKSTSKAGIISALSEGMVSIANNLTMSGNKTSAVEVDLCFWVASQVYFLDFPAKYSTANNIFSKSDFINHSSSLYYLSGRELANHESRKNYRRKTNGEEFTGSLF
ncbi:MAG: hypothetical protein ACP5N2_01855 [Candidatus Nanoarchaeia archaeon]